MTTPITIAYGDGIGPEIMQATLKILQAAGADIAPEVIEIGKAVYERGIVSGIECSSWESLRKTKVFLKAPITTPQGGGFKSLNVTVRKTLGLYANVRPCVAYSPYVKTLHPHMNVTIVRENEEDLYAGIEYQQTPQVCHALKIITRPGCERIIRYAFEYARSNNRKKLSCFSKDNIMKITDGLFHNVFDEIKQEYPDIETDHWIIDIGTARLACRPELFDVIVTENLYGDIISDVAAELTGSVGLGGSANIGEHCAMFEAIHGSAPDIAGQGIANPSGLLLGAIMMLVHICQNQVAAKIHNAWLRTLESGIHTADIYDADLSKQKVGCQAFADAVIDNLGELPSKFATVSYGDVCMTKHTYTPDNTQAIKRERIGCDVFIYDANISAQQLAEKIQQITIEGLALNTITNRGAEVWPQGKPETFCTDQWRCRFEHPEHQAVSQTQILQLLQALTEMGVDVTKTEGLFRF